MTKNRILINKLFDRYFIKGLNGMALGLFCTLIVGVIIKQVGLSIGNDIGQILVNLGSIASLCMGAVIGIAVAHAMDAPKLIIFASGVTGFIGANAKLLLDVNTINESGKIVTATTGDPLTSFIVVIIGIEVGRLVFGKTKVDIIITPLVTIISSTIVALIIGTPISNLMGFISSSIESATNLQPFAMGVIISVLMGVALTLPISSAAIAIILGLSGLPAGAATVGCCSQMIGFAVSSFPENKWNGFFAQGIGTSMLQMPNIIKKPMIWVPPIITSAIMGPIATMTFKMENIPAGAGMGTSALIGPIMTFQSMSTSGNIAVLIGQILLLHIILPALLSFLISSFMRKKGYIKFGDMKLDI